MRTILSTVLVLTTLMSIGQDKIWSGDTTFWYNLITDEWKRVGIEEISSSQNLLRTKIATYNKIVEIWADDDCTFYGMQVLYFASFDLNYIKDPLYYSKREILNNDTAKLVQDLILKYKIHELPIEDSIMGWGHSLGSVVYVDIDSYFIENSTVYSYSFKTYADPSVYRSIPEAARFAEFLYDLNALLGQELKLNHFFDSLPYGNCYSIGGSLIRCK
ncbi:MAG: hypothetical protein FD170_2048 [Bacteroidetes bacterium]|nr:MAG: hypothetical protein FD170_2048 [Bacteroidota bacterium]